MCPAEPTPPAADPFATLASTVLLAQLPVAAAALDAAGRVVAWNPAAERLTGLTAAMMAGATSLPGAVGLTGADGEALAPTADPVVLALGEGRPREARLLLRRADGAAIPVLLRAAPLRDGVGRTVGAVAILETDTGGAALIDPATGLATRPVLEGRLRAALAEFERLMSPSGVVLVAVDGLDEVAARAGRPVADARLRAAATALTISARPYDLVGRWEGDTLLVLIREVEADDLGAVAERLRGLVAAAEGAPPTLARPLTASFGGALTARDDTIDSIVGRARAALEEARAAGGNQIRLTKSPTIPPAAGPDPSALAPDRLDHALQRLTDDLHGKPNRSG